VQFLVWQSIINKNPSLVVMFSEAMLAGYHKKIYITSREEVAEVLNELNDKMDSPREDFCYGY